MLQIIREMLEHRVGLTNGRMRTVAFGDTDIENQPQHIDLATQTGALTVLESASNAALHMQAIFHKYVAKEFGPEIDTTFFRFEPPHNDVVLMIRRHLPDARLAQLLRDGIFMEPTNSDYFRRRLCSVEQVTMSLISFPAGNTRKNFH
ncbi:unnamed protein product, partial [Mesorhabditis spiculigera]